MRRATSCPSRVRAGTFAQRLIALLALGAELDAPTKDLLDVGGRAQVHRPSSPSTMIASPFSAIETAPLACPTTGMPSARATITTWLVAPPSSSTRAADLLAPVVQKLGPRPWSARRSRRRLTRRRRTCRRRAPNQLAQEAVGEIVEIVQAARAGTGRRRASSRARMSFCTFSTEASAVRPVAHGPPPAGAPSRGPCGEHAVGFEHGAVLPSTAMSRRWSMSSIEMRSEDTAFSRRATSASASSLKRLVDDDARLVEDDVAEPDPVGERQPLEVDGTRHRSRTTRGADRPSRLPAAIISATTMATVSSARSPRRG